MPKIPGINHKDAIRAFQKSGFVIVRQSGHIVLRRAETILVIPRGNPIESFTMGDLVRVAGLTPEQFRDLLK
jgi:predicted RNA binding protein YcfA (HicA-like mRNA interferase family)